MRFHLALTLQAVWTSVCQAAMQHYPAAWGHYDVCKSQVYSDEGLTWDYMACQPEAADMTQYLKVTLDPPNITCGDPPETYCALVSTWQKHTLSQLSYLSPYTEYYSDPRAVTETFKACDSDMLRKWRLVPIDVMFCCLKSCFPVCTANTVWCAVDAAYLQKNTVQCDFRNEDICSPNTHQRCLEVQLCDFKAFPSCVSSNVVINEWVS